MVVDISSLNRLQLPPEPSRSWRLQCGRPVVHHGVPERRCGVNSPEKNWTAPKSRTCRATCAALDLDPDGHVSGASNTEQATDWAQFGGRVSDERLSEQSRDACSNHSEKPGDHAVPPPHGKSPPMPRPSPAPSDEAKPTDSCRFSFTTRSLPRPKGTLAFQVDSILRGRRTLKRARPATDVDGPNTSTLSCKKRRLRLELITSRLSQPFSLPATHILNREGLACGDKRFLKMATHADMVRRGLAINSSSSPFRRVAVLNRTRLYVRDAHLHDLGVLLSRTIIGRSTASQYNSLYPASGGMPVSSCSRRPPLMEQFAQTLPTPAVVRRSRSPLPSPPASPRLRPAELVDAPRNADFDDEEDGEAFPTADHGSIYDTDDPDDVYSDFAVIFGSGAGAGEGTGSTGTSDEDEHSYEEYLDELDGISWAVR